jgi:hypothetical protein
MSRVAKQPVQLPQGVTATITADQVSLKGAKGTLSVPLTHGVTVEQKAQTLEVKYTVENRMQAGRIHPAPQSPRRRRGCPDAFNDVWPFRGGEGQLPPCCRGRASFLPASHAFPRAGCMPLYG